MRCFGIAEVRAMCIYDTDDNGMKFTALGGVDGKDAV